MSSPNPGTVSMRVGALCRIGAALFILSLGGCRACFSPVLPPTPGEGARTGLEAFQRTRLASIPNHLAGQPTIIILPR